MTDEEAKRYADKMGYTEAIWNVMQGYGIPYKKATKTKLVRLVGEVVAERSKIEKAIAEIESAKDTQIRIGLDCTDPQEHEKHLCAEQALALALEIIKRNIGEREEE